MNSCSERNGDLKMVKVKKSRKGHRKSRSLVFRISRGTTKPADGSYETVCDSLEQRISSKEESLNGRPRALKVKIPKSILQNHAKDHNISGTVNPPEKLDSQTKSNQLTEALSLNTDIENTVFPEQRRSSRRLLRVRNSPSVSLNEDTKMKDQRLPSDLLASSKIKGSRGEKKRRGRKPGTKAGTSELPRRRKVGRPPKCSQNGKNRIKNLAVVQPVYSGKFQNDTEKLLLKPSKNSVWTLVPKELLESDFFKSQVLKVRFALPKNKIQSNFVSSTSSCSPPMPDSPVPLIYEKKVSNFSRFIQPASCMQQNSKLDDLKDYKRPTVIYFKSEKKNLSNTENQFSPSKNSELHLEKQLCKTQNDLAYLFDKYHMIDDETVANYYDFAAGNLNEAETMLEYLLSNNRTVHSELKEQQCIAARLKSSISTDISSQCPVTDFTSSVPVTVHNDPSYKLNSTSAFDADDILSRKIIIESLRILNDEEAVLS